MTVDAITIGTDTVQNKNGDLEAASRGLVFGRSSNGAAFAAGQQKEERILAELDHPNIVRLQDAGVTDGEEGEGERKTLLARIVAMLTRMCRG